MSTSSYRDAAKRNYEALKKLYETNDDLGCARRATIPGQRMEIPRTKH